VRILNIDARDDGIEAFLRARGAEQFVRQREMERPLTPGGNLSSRAAGGTKPRSGEMRRTAKELRIRGSGWNPLALRGSGWNRES
jgi:hypothetical protein